jgi:GDP-L-fucose synthase
MLRSKRPDVVVLAAAKVGGIYANNEYPAEFIFENLKMECNVIHGSYLAGVEKLLFLGSSCIYPKHADQPMREDALLNGPLEPTNEPYAIAKIAGIKLCESYNRQYDVDYRSVMPTNLYGPCDNFDLKNAHVIPALIRRIHEAKLQASPHVEIWGTGKARREFMHVDDLADACFYVMRVEQVCYAAVTEPMCSHINIGTGQDVTITELACMIKDIIGYRGELIYDTRMPDGTPRKLLDVSRAKSLGWQAGIALEEGLNRTYKWFLNNQAKIRR